MSFCVMANQSRDHSKGLAKVRYVLELPLEYTGPIMLLPWRYYEDLKNSQSPTFAHRIGVAVPIAGMPRVIYTAGARGTRQVH